MTKVQVINVFNTWFTPKLGIHQHPKEGAIAAYLDKASQPTPTTSTHPAPKPITKSEFMLVYDTCTGNLSTPSGRCGDAALFVQAVVIGTASQPQQLDPSQHQKIKYIPLYHNLDTFCGQDLCAITDSHHHLTALHTLNGETLTLMHLL